MRASLSKDRDMARSILPSRHRRTARAAKARIKRAHRRSVARDLEAAARLRDLHEWDDDADLRRRPSADIRRVVQGRRAGDKLHHFERWAIAVTADLPVEERLDAMRRRLPRGLVGDHAMAHLRWRPELQPDPTYHWRAAWLRRLAEAQRARDEERSALVRAVEDLVDHGGHRSLNAAMKATARPAAGLPARSPLLLVDPRAAEAFVDGLYLPTGLPDPARSAERRALARVLTRRPPPGA